MKASEIRKQFLQEVPAIVERVCKAYSENTPIASLTKQEEALLKHLWPTIHSLITAVEDAAEVANLSSGTISERVDSVLEQVASGTLTIQQGKRLIEMLQAGFDITELPKLIEKLAEIES